LGWPMLFDQMLQPKGKISSSTQAQIGLRLLPITEFALPDDGISYQ
jgi:hypothetical protein